MISKIGSFLFLASGLYLWIAQVSMFNYWWGSIGLLISIFLPPVAALFPIIFWVKEGIFPTTLFLVWGIGIVGAYMMSADATSGPIDPYDPYR